MKNKNLTSQNIKNYLLKEIPEFKTNKEAPIEELLGEFTQFILSQYRQINLQQKNSKILFELIRRGLNIMEQAIRSPNLELQELISVYFLETLQGEEYYEEIREILGPKLREELRHWE